MKIDPIGAAGEAVSASIEQRHAFETLVRQWRLAEMGPGPEASTDQQRDWERPEADAHRMALAREVLTFPIPEGHLCLLRDKLDVLIYFASIFGQGIDPIERMVLNGICALRADIVHYGG